MASKYKDKDPGVLLSINGQWVSWLHTTTAYGELLICFDPLRMVWRLTDSRTRTAAFISALVVGIALHYQKIVQNEWYGYPEEWFPSVSSTIGDRYPERSFFMFFIAITSGRTQPSDPVVAGR